MAHRPSLIASTRQELDKLDLVLQELMNRPRPDYSSKRAMIEGELPKLLEIGAMVGKCRKRPAPVMTWAKVGAALEAKRLRETAELKALAHDLRQWNIFLTV